MKLKQTLKATLLMALIISSASMAEVNQPTFDISKVAFEGLLQYAQPDWVDVILTKESDNNYNVFTQTDWKKAGQLDYKVTLSFPSPIRNMTCDEQKHLFYLAGTDFVSISYDGANWYTTTDRVEVPPFVNIGSDGKSYAISLFSTKNIPNKPSYIPSFITIGNDN
ncbi:MAG: hypothetical protein K2W97_04105 [Chthoniobacterales bacterium]|nr:hypothetical protein [Chthoniobacterales bacterium]